MLRTHLNNKKIWCAPTISAFKNVVQRFEIKVEIGVILQLSLCVWIKNFYLISSRKASN